MLTKQIWQHIAALGAARGLDVETLADAAHISSTRVQAFADGVGIMRLDDLVAFSQALSMSIAEMLDGIDE